MPQAKPVSCCRRVTRGKKQQLIFETTEGQRITLQDGPPAIVIEDQVGNSIRLENGKITVQGVGAIEVQAPVVQVDASELLLNAPTVQCSGILQATTVIATTVSASEYTPGAGNVW